MATDTTRDRLWKTALAETHKHGRELSAKGLANYQDVSERTARDALKSMATEPGPLRSKKDGHRTIFVADDRYAAKVFG